MNGKRGLPVNLPDPPYSDYSVSRSIQVRSREAFAILHGSVGLVAQSVEQRTENPCVGGSIPPQATTTAVLLARKCATKNHSTVVAQF